MRGFLSVLLVIACTVLPAEGACAKSLEPRAPAGNSGDDDLAPPASTGDRAKHDEAANAGTTRSKKPRPLLPRKATTRSMMKRRLRQGRGRRRAMPRQPNSLRDQLDVLDAEIGCGGNKAPSKNRRAVTFPSRACPQFTDSQIGVAIIPGGSV